MAHRMMHRFNVVLYTCISTEGCIACFIGIYAVTEVINMQYFLTVTVLRSDINKLTLNLIELLNTAAYIVFY